MKKSEAPKSGCFDPSAQLKALLHKIVGGLERSVDLFKKAAEGSQLPAPVQVEDGDIELAAKYLRDLGLAHDGQRLLNEYARLFKSVTNEWLASMVESQEFPREQITELYGPFPSRGSPNDPIVADRMVTILGFAVQLSKYVTELISRLDTPRTPPKSISHDEAEAVARRLDKKDVTFCHLTAEDMAARIAQESHKLCSDTLVKGLPYWDYAMERTGRGRNKSDINGQGRKRGTAARPDNFSGKLEAVTGKGKKHEVLESLVEDEERIKNERAIQEKQQAISFVDRSRLNPQEKQDTIAKLKAGQMTAQQAAEMVSILEQDPKRNRKKKPSRD